MLQDAKQAQNMIQSVKDDHKALGEWIEKLNDKMQKISSDTIQLKKKMPSKDLEMETKIKD